MARAPLDPELVRAQLLGEQPPSVDTVAALFARWRRSKDPNLATLLDRLSRACLPGLDVPRLRNKPLFHRAWLGVAKAPPTPAHVSWLGDHLLTQLPLSSRNWSARTPLSRVDRALPAFHARLTALVALGPDPRISAAVTTAVVESPFAFDSDESLELAFSAAWRAISVDARQIDVLLEAQRRPRARAAITRRLLNERFPRLITAARRAAAAATPEPAWARLVEALDAGTSAKPKRSTTSPAEALLTREADDAPRLVYADALTEQGDPRGEFIALQLEANPSDAARRRARALLKAHQAQWLGPLAKVFTHHDFRRGFLYAAALAHRAKAEDQEWVEAAAHPELRFVRRLRKGRGSDALYRSFLDAPHGEGLIDVDAPSAAFVSALLETPRRPYRRLVVSRLADVAPFKAAALAFPELRTLGFDGVDRARSGAALLEALEAAGLTSRLTHVEVAINGLTDADELARATLSLLTRRGSRVERVGFWAHNAFISVRRDGLVEGHDEWLWAASRVLPWLTEPSRVSLVTSTTNRSADATRVLRWFDDHGAPHTLTTAPSVDAAAFHDGVLSQLSS